MLARLAYANAVRPQISGHCARLLPRALHPYPVFSSFGATVPTDSRTLPTVNATAFIHTRRSFASSSSSSTTTSATLVDLLAREHLEELDNDSIRLPPALSELKAQVAQIWTIVDDGPITRLHRTLASNKVKVQIDFHCQDTVEEEEEQQDEQEDDSNAPEEEEEEENAAQVRFTVTLTKAGKSLIIVCLSTPDVSIDIQSATTVPAQDHVTADKDTGFSVSPNHYQGPEFGDLAEDLQDAFYSYLKEDLGVTSDVVSFITMYCDFKEQTEYVQFLEDAQKLLA
jgi:complement component 1 Q subcomponent-binding protein, mitochondrial